MLDLVLSIVFWGCLALIVYTYAGYPLLVSAIGAFSRPCAGTSNINRASRF